MDKNSWELISRKNIVQSSFLQIFEDKVRLPNGKVIDDYTVVKKPDIVIVVATTQDDKVLAIQEYKYAADQVLNTLPAGHVEKEELILDAAKRELLEETGYTGDEFTLRQTLCEYPTKDLHKVHVVSVKNVRLVSDQALEYTEGIEKIRLLDTKELQDEIEAGKWTITAVLAAFAISGILKTRD